MLLEDGGVSDFRFGDGRTPSFEAVQVDRRLKDQDTVALGGVTVTAHHHPGHTKGATSFTLTVREGGRDYRVVIANMGSINPGVTVSGMPKYPTIGDDYARTFAAQKALPVDVFLASHARNSACTKNTSPATPTIRTGSSTRRAISPPSSGSKHLPRAARARTRRRAERVLLSALVAVAADRSLHLIERHSLNRRGGRSAARPQPAT